MEIAIAFLFVFTVKLFDLSLPLFVLHKTFHGSGKPSITPVGGNHDERNNKSVLPLGGVNV